MTFHLHAGFTASDDDNEDEVRLQNASVANLPSEADVLQVTSASFCNVQHVSILPPAVLSFICSADHALLTLFAQTFICLFIHSFIALKHSLLWVSG